MAEDPSRPNSLSSSPPPSPQNFPPITSPSLPHNSPPPTSPPSAQNSPPPPSQNSPPTSPPSQNSPHPTEPPCDQSPQINPEVKTDPSPLHDIQGIQMWESFNQKGIEHEFTQDLAHFSVLYSQIFYANSQHFYERCVELLENIPLPPTPIPPSVMQEIENLPRFLEDTREQRLLIMENVRRSLPTDAAHSQVSATSSQTSTASACSASEEVNSYSYENETLVNLLNPNNLNLFCERVAKFSEYLAKNKSNSATSSSSPPN